MLIGIDGNEANIEKRVGSNQYAFELLWALYKLGSPHQFIIYLCQKPLSDMPKEKKNWSYKVFGPKRFWTRWRLPLGLYFGRPRPDVFFTPGHYAPSFSPIPFVCSIMDLGYLRFPEQLTRKDLLQLSVWTASSIKKADHILAISKSTKNDIIKVYDVSEKKITVTYPGYDKTEFKCQISKIKIGKVKRKYKIEGEYILFLGTLKPRKNIERLIEAFSILNSHPPAGGSILNLVIAGKKGWLYQTIFSKVKELALEKQVVFTGFVPEDEVPLLMAGARVFVLPSLWEGFGIPVVEAMACGVPVVVSSAGSLPEVVGEAGVIVDPYSSDDIARGIKRALEQRRELVRKGREQAKKFSWAKTAQKTLKVLEKIK